VGQRYIERPVSQVQDANTSDLTHSTGTQGIVSLHVHDHGNGGDITKGCDKIGMEGKAAAREGIIQSLKKLSQCFVILERVTWNKSNKLSNIVKIIYVILHHLGFRKYAVSCDLDHK